MLIGITGNIGAGKTSVCRFIKRYGFTVIDADDIGKNILREKHIIEKVKETFGNSIIEHNGTINHRKLGSIVFSDRKNLEKLTKIMYPEIEATILQIKKQYAQSITFIEAAVILEAGWERMFDRIVTVFAPKGLRILRASRKFGIKETIRRDKLQLPYKEKLKATDYLICNNGCLINLLEQTQNLINQIVRETEDEKILCNNTDILC